MATENKKYKRVMLKLSGEAMASDKGFGIDPEVVYRLAGEIKEASDAGIEDRCRCRWRAISGESQGSQGGMDRASADTWACSRLSSIPSLCRMRLKNLVSPPAYRQPSKCSRSQSLTSAAVRSAILKRAES